MAERVNSIIPPSRPSSRRWRALKSRNPEPPKPTRSTADATASTCALYPLEVRTSLLALFLIVAPLAAQDWELGGVIGYGAYRNGSIIAPAGTGTAGIRSRFAAGVVV